VNPFTRRVELPNWALLALMALGALSALSFNVAIGEGWSHLARVAFLIGLLLFNQYRRNLAPRPSESFARITR
jgi:hypothetical protein